MSLHDRLLNHRLRWVLPLAYAQHDVANTVSRRIDNLVQSLFRVDASTVVGVDPDTRETCAYFTLPLRAMNTDGMEQKLDDAIKGAYHERRAAPESLLGLWKVRGKGRCIGATTLVIAGNEGVARELHQRAVGFPADDVELRGWVRDDALRDANGDPIDTLVAYADNGDM